MSGALAACLLLLLASTSAAASSDDVCAGGGCAATASPVCGADGLTYANDCLARCQGVEVQAAGGCATAAGAGGAPGVAEVDTAMADLLLTAASAVEVSGRLVTADTMRAFHHEGLRMVGVLPAAAFRPRMPVVAADDLARIERGARRRGTTMMVDAAGNLYAAPPNAAVSGPAAALAAADADADTVVDGGAMLEQQLADAAALGLEAASSASSATAADAADAVDAAPDASAGAARPAGIIGRDTRTEVATTPKYPYSAAGHIMFTSPDGGGGRYQCSGALVGAYAVLTAAHCVVARSGAVQRSITFTAGETARNGTGLGQAKGVRVYFNSQYLGDDWMSWDAGVIVLDRPLGAASAAEYAAALRDLEGRAADFKRVTGNSLDTRAMQLPAWVPGRLGYAASPRLDNTLLLSMGYPGDKPLGSAWEMTCSVTDSSPLSSVLSNSCPIKAGQSGSSMMERRTVNGKPSYLVRAIVSFEMCATVCDGACCNGVVSYNGALKITPFFKAFVDQHAGATPADAARR